MTEAYKELKEVKTESLFLFKTCWRHADLSVGCISDCESVLKHVQWGEATSISSNTLCGFRITFGPIRHWNLAVNHGGRNSTVKLTHHNRFDHKPQIPSRPCAYKKTVTYLKIWSGPDSHIKHMPNAALITQYRLSWSQFWPGELDVTYCLRWVLLLSELLKGHRGEFEVRTFIFSGFSKQAKQVFWGQHCTTTDTERPQKLQNWFGLFFLFWFACCEMFACVCVWWWECLVIVLRAKCALTNIVKPGSSYVLIKL